MRAVKPIFSLLLLAIVLLETYYHVRGVKELEIGQVSMLYFICGILIAILPLIKTSIRLKQKSNSFLKGMTRSIYFIFVAGIVFHSIREVIPLFEKFAIDIKWADMLPVIKIMCDRFVKGEFVYEIVPIWSGTEPIYLPAMWLPFLPFNYFQIDIRWTSMLALLGVVLLILFISKRSAFKLKNALVFFPLLLIVDGLLHYDSRLIYLTEEPIVVFYYIFLAYALAKDKAYLIGIALSLCLLSRFALVFWSFMYIAYIFCFQDKEKALKIGITTASICVVLILITGAFWQLNTIKELPNIYVNHIMENEWKFNGFMKTNLGMIKFFSFESVPLLHRIFFIGNVLIPISCFLLYWKFNRWINTRFFAICSLKLCLVFFYNFLIMPFMYLFYTSTFLSIAILSWYLKEEFATV
jgi:hypothetical protein